MSVAFKDNLERLLKDASGIKLDIGCGFGKQDGWVGLDKRPIPQADVIHDLEKTPWPLPTGCAITVLCSHILEHIDPRNFLSVMEEIHRVSKHACQVQISTPYAGSFGGYQDPTHTRPGFNEATFLYFDPRPINREPNILYDIYKPSPFFLERLHWDVSGNLEVLLRVVKDPMLVKTTVKAMLKKPRKMRIVQRGEE